MFNVLAFLCCIVRRCFCHGTMEGAASVSRPRYVQHLAQWDEGRDRSVSWILGAVWSFSDQSAKPSIHLWCHIPCKQFRALAAAIIHLNGAEDQDFVRVNRSLKRILGLSTSILVAIPRGVKLEKFKADTLAMISGKLERLISRVSDRPSYSENETEGKTLFLKQVSRLYFADTKLVGMAKERLERRSWVPRLRPGEEFPGQFHSDHLFQGRPSLYHLM